MENESARRIYLLNSTTFAAICCLQLLYRKIVALSFFLDFLKTNVASLQM